MLEKLVSELEKMPVGGKKKGEVKSAALTSEAVSKDKKAVVKKAKPVKGKAKKK